MQERPIGDLLFALNNAGCNINCNNCNESLPITVKSGFPGGKIILDASTSSQFASSILMASPFADKQVELTLKGEIGFIIFYLNFNWSFGNVYSDDCWFNETMGDRY